MVDNTTTVKVLCEILAKHDPDSLIEIGAPRDEYEGFANTIVKELHRSITTEQILDLLTKVFSIQDFELNNWTDKRIISISAPRERRARLKAAAMEVHHWLHSDE